MDLNEIISILVTVFLSAGGAAAIIIGVVKWMGQIWADKQQAQYQLDIFKATLLRYSGEQFTLYNKLWHSLYDLKKAGDKLWEIANNPNLRIFSKQFEITSDEIEKNYLLLEKNHYEQLTMLLKPLNEYQIRKGELILKRARSRANVTEDEINQLINDNRQTKQKYERLLDIIREDFRKQVRGDS